MARTMTIGTRFQAIDAMSKPMRTMGLQSDKMAGRMKRSFSGVASTLRTIRKIATVAFAAVGLSATLMVGSVARDFATFDNAMLTSASKFSDLDLSIQSGVDTYNRMKTVARDVGATTKFTSAEAAEGLNYLAMAGFNAEQAMVALPKTTNLAIVAGTDLARATDITTDSLGAFGLMAQDTAQLQTNLGRVNDVYAKTVNRTNTNLEDLFEAVKKGAPTFTAAGQRMETFNALAGVMANSGVKGAEAGTSLRNVMLRLSKPTGEASKYLRRLGVQTMDGNGNFRDAIDILADLEKGLVGMGTQQRAAALSTIFGARAVTGVNILLAAGTGNLRDFRTELDNSAGTADKMALVIGQSLTNRMLGLKSAAMEVGFQFAESFDEQAGAAIDSLTAKLRTVDVQPIVDGIVNGTNTIIDLWNTGVIKTVASVIGAFIGLKVVIGIVATLSTAVKGLSILLGVLLAHPILLAIAGIAAGAGLIIANWDKIWPVFDKGIQGMKDGMIAFIDLVVAGWDKLAGLGEPIKQAFSAVMGYFKPFQDAIASAFDNFTNGKWVQGIADIGDAILKFLFAPIQMVWDILYNIVDFVLNKFKNPPTVTPPQTVADRYTQGGFAPAVTTNEGRVNQYSDWYAKNPVSPNAGVVETRNTNTSQVEVTFTNPPDGTQIRKNGNAPGLVLNTGTRTRAW